MKKYISVIVVIALVFGGFLIYSSGVNLGALIGIPTSSFDNKIPEGSIKDKSELVLGTWAFIIPKFKTNTRNAAVKNKYNTALILSRATATNTWILGITSFNPDTPFSYPISTIDIVRKGQSYKLSCGLLDQYHSLRQCSNNGVMSAMQLSPGDVRKLAEGDTVKLTLGGYGKVSWTFPLSGSSLAIKNIMNWK